MKLSIPVRPYVHAYFTHPERYGKGPIELKRDSLLWSLVFNACAAVQLPDDELETFTPTNTDRDGNEVEMLSLELLLPLTFRRIFPGKISGDRIGVALERVFRLALSDYVEGAIDLFRNEERAIGRFYKRYRISVDDLPMDNAKKICQRLRNQPLDKNKKVRPKIGQNANMTVPIGA